MFALNGHHDRLVSGILANGFSVAEAALITPQQREAIPALIDHTNGDILAWLKLARSVWSLEPIPEQSAGGAPLSPSMIHALFALKECPDDRLLHCLELARIYRHEPSTTPLARGLPIESGLSNKRSSFLGQSATLLYAAQPWLNAAEQHPLKPDSSPDSQPHAADELSGHQLIIRDNSAFPKHAENHYWCTVCEFPNSYKDSGNWKKHEKGHETVFVCGLDNVIEESWVGQASSSTSFSCKRRDIMVNHLNKLHGISAVQQARDLADKWRVSVRKQAWSCGFCVSVFLNFHDRLKHIDIEHFRKHEDIKNWDFNKVIHGLLLQSSMETVWKKRTQSLHPWEQPEDIVWPEHFAKNMRTKLEIGPSDETDAINLADAVYTAGRRKESWHKDVMRSATVVGVDMAGANLLVPHNQDQTIAVQAPGSRGERGQGLSTTRATAHLSDDLLLALPPRQACVDENKALPPRMSSNEDNQGDYHATSFFPSQNWAVMPEAGNDPSSYDQVANDSNRGPFQLTGSWNGQ